jgi:NADH-quinone oxidoreductase subunit N
VLGVLFSVVSLYYYMRIVAAMFLVKPREEAATETSYGRVSLGLLGLLSLATLALGLAPAWIVKLAEEAAKGMLPRI